MKSSNKLFFFIAAITIVLASCKKNHSYEKDKDTTGATDNALAEAMFMDLKNIADQAESGNMVFYRGAEDTAVFGCATVISDTTVTPNSLIIDFGTVNCLCNDGNNRRGKIMVSYNGPYRDSGTVITHTPDNYFVNDNQLTGSKTVTNMGHDANGNLWYDIDVNGTVIKSGGGGTITWTSERQRTWIAGESTLTWLDDVYLITGWAAGTRVTNEPFNAIIITPLRKEIGCRHIVSGSFDFTSGVRPVRRLDYGSGTCDNNATVTLDGVTYNIVLP
jgi:hypothetical protein